MIIAVVVHPNHTEGKHPLGLHDAVEQVGLLILRMLVHHGGDGGQDFLHGLYELGFIAVLLLYIFDDACDIGIHNW